MFSPDISILVFIAALFLYLVAILLNEYKIFKLKYRIKHIEGVGYWAQVRLSFFGSWKTIGMHIDDFGLYDGSEERYPLLESRYALERISQYKAWRAAQSRKPTYEEVS